MSIMDIMKKRVLIIGVVILLIVISIIFVLNNKVKEGDSCQTDFDCKFIRCQKWGEPIVSPSPLPECVNNTCKCGYEYCKRLGGCD